MPASSAVFHNALFDATILHRQGRKPKIEDDTMVMASVLGYQDISLKGLCQELFGVKTVAYGEGAEGDPWYLAQDLFLTRQLRDRLKPEIRGTAYEIDLKLVPILVDMSFRGYEIDRDLLAKRIKEAERAKDRAKAKFGELFPDVAIGSPIQLQRAMGVETTGAEFLKAVVAGSGTLAEPAMWVLEYRKWAKLLSTYLIPMTKVEKVTGLFNLTPSEEGAGGTTTGRLSSRDFNLQNLPPEAFTVLRAPEGFLILRADIKQIELCWAAEVSESEYLIDALRSGRDLHQETAALLGLPNRQAGKKWNFAVLYGAEEYRLAEITGMPIEWCAQALKRFRAGPWKALFDWMEEHWRETYRSSYSTGPEPFLHRRYIPLLSTKHARKQAGNHPIQMSAAYTVKAMLNEADREFPLGVNLIHDEPHWFVPDSVDPELTVKKCRGILIEVGEKYLPRVGIDVSVSLSRYWEAK